MRGRSRLTVPFLFRLFAAFVLLAGLGPAQAAPDTEIPFRTPGSPYILLEARLSGSGPFTLLLDTGNATPFAVALSPEAARRAGARPGGGAPFISRAATGGPVRLDPWTLPQLSVGPVRLTNVSAGVTGAVELAGSGLGIHLDGIIGHMFLAGRVVAIDYPCRRVDLAAAPPRTPPSARFTVAPVRPLLLVEARVNGRGPYRLVLDTGSGHNILSAATARAAGIATSGKTTLAGAGGVERDGRTGRAEIAFAGAPPRRTRVVVSALIDRVAREAGTPIDGIAGMALFAAGRLVLDYPGRRLWLLPPRPCQG